MEIYSGSLMLIKVKTAEGFKVIGGLKTTRMVLNQEMVEVSNKLSGNWRKLLAQSGISHLSISGGGIFTNSEAEKFVREHVMENKFLECQLVFGSGEFVDGLFQITNYERMGNYNEEENYNLTLESAGKIIWSG
jgi:TP901-1 family phage major tail protein